MDKLKHLFILALLVANNQFCLAQKSISSNENKSITTSMQERIFLHSNATTFITGETLYYKAYCLNPVDNSMSLISKIVYAELIDSNKQTVFKSKIYLENGTGEGNYFIPTTLKTGNYKLITYTKWMLNASLTNIYDVDITIINPFQPYEGGSVSKENSEILKKEDSSIKPNLLNLSLADRKDFTLETEKKIYGNREKVNLKIKTLTENIEKGSYSVSVRKIGNLPTKRQKSAEEFVKTSNARTIAPLTKEAIVFLPELRGEIITGFISSKNQKSSLNDKLVSLSIPGKSFASKIAKTNQSGNFTFILDKDPNNSNCVIQVMDANRNDYSIQLDESPKLETPFLDFSSELNLAMKDSVAIQEQSIANQIENAYYQIKKDSLVLDSKTAPFFNSVQKDYILDDYTRFPTLKETIIEVVIEMYFRKNNNSYSIYVRDNTKDLEIYGPPLVLVDGVVIQDVNQLFDYNMSNIYKISVINQGYIYGSGIFGGLVSFETKNNDFQTKLSGDFIKKIDIQRPLTQNKFFSPDYDANINIYKRIPDYRFQLLWMPEVALGNKENSISFYTSDVSGEFEIAVEGFTEKGIPVSLKESIEVK